MHRVNAPEVDTYTCETTAQLMVKNVLIVMTQVTSLHYIESPTDNIPELPRTVEQEPILTQRGIRDWQANAGRVDQVAEAGSPTVATVEAHPQTVHAPEDLQPCQQMQLNPLQVSTR